jgi:hypothetical protein
MRIAQLYGLRLEHTFRAAATKFLEENRHKKSIADDVKHLRLLDPFIGGTDAEAGSHGIPQALHR